MPKIGIRLETDLPIPFVDDEMLAESAPYKLHEKIVLNNGQKKGF